MRASEDGMTDAESRIDIEAALQRLPLEYRAIAVAYYLGDCPCVVIAAYYGITVSAVYCRLGRARRILRDTLA